MHSKCTRPTVEHAVRYRLALARGRDEERCPSALLRLARVPHQLRLASIASGRRLLIVYRLVPVSTLCLPKLHLAVPARAEEAAAPVWNDKL